MRLDHHVSSQYAAPAEAAMITAQGQTSAD
jgi:hypothetical protein